VRDRVLVALTNPEVTGSSGIRAATLMAFQEPMAIFEWVGAGKGLVLIHHAGLVDGGLGQCLDRVFAAQEKGLLFVAVAGGDASVADELRTAIARAKKPTRLGLYHADEAGRIEHMAGRRLPELEKVGRALPECGPLSPEDIEAIGERGRRERQEALEFVSNSHRRFPYATMAMMAVCFLFYAITAGSDERAHRLFDLLSNRPDGIQQGEYWRLFTYALLHGNGMHLVVNMLSLYSLGALLEPLLGRRRLGLLCGATAVAGGVASALLTRVPSVGASGAVWGLLGATLGLLTDRRSGFPPLLARILRQRLIVILVLNIGMSFLPHIDRYCHFGGGLAGYLIALAFVRTSARRT
jgi:membrane associated rhomboid family serine protease